MHRDKAIVCLFVCLLLFNYLLNFYHFINVLCCFEFVLWGWTAWTWKFIKSYSVEWSAFSLFCSTFCLVDKEETCMAVTVYNLAQGKGVIIGDSVAIPEPYLTEVHFKYKQKVRSRWIFNIGDYSFEHCPFCESAASFFRWLVNIALIFFNK